jgi:hypothetical protein
VFESQVGPSFLPFLRILARQSLFLPLGEHPSLWPRRKILVTQAFIDSTSSYQGSEQHLPSPETEYRQERVHDTFCDRASRSKASTCISRPRSSFASRRNLRWCKRSSRHFSFRTYKRQPGKKRDDDTRLAKYKSEVIEELMRMLVPRSRAHHPRYRVLNREKLNALLNKVLIAITFLTWYTMSGMDDRHVTTLQALVATNAEYVNQGS